MEQVLLHTFQGLPPGTTGEPPQIGLSRAETGERRPGWLFGPEFTTTEVDDLRKSIVASRRLAPVARLRERAPQEEFIDEKGYRLEPQCSTRIEGRKSGMAGFRPKFLRALPPLQGGVKLPFQAGHRRAGLLPGHLEGTHPRPGAARANDSRGQLVSGEPGPLFHTGQTRYPGRHYAEGKWCSTASWWPATIMKWSSVESHPEHDRTQRRRSASKRERPAERQPGTGRSGSTRRTTTATGLGRPWPGAVRDASGRIGGAEARLWNAVQGQKIDPCSPSRAHRGRDSS